MIDLKQAIGEQKGETWVKFGKSFELLISYLSKRKLEELKAQHSGLKERREAKLFFVVKDWRGLTAKELVEITKGDYEYLRTLSPEELKKEVPFSQEGLLVLVDTVYDLEEFIFIQCTNHLLFRPADWEKLIKNSGSGETLSSPHEKSPA